MQQNWLNRLLLSIAILAITLSTWAITPAAHAFNNPDLLPQNQTPVIDLAGIFTDIQENLLAKDIEDFETQTGWKVRVLTQFDQTPGRAVKDYWGLDDKSVLVVADERGGNILNFSVGRQIYPFLSRTFWVELQTRFGNQYFVRENGEDQSIIQSIDTIQSCLIQGGCRVVPGLPPEQWILTLITSAIGGVICGVASIPRKSGQLISWQWALIFSPLWGILFIAFGIGPVISRTQEWLPLVRNISGFLIGFLVAYLTPILNQSFSQEG